jgi:CheY-like chemotaxis protein
VPERILLVDDSWDDALVVRNALQKAGLQAPVLWVDDSEEAMAYLMGEKDYADRAKRPLPQIVLLDLRMPKVDGLEFLRRMKAQPHLERLMVVVVTGVRDAKLIAEAYQLGAHSYLAKDSTTQEFESFVSFLKTYTAEDRAKGHVQESTAAPRKQA